ncbi:MAG: DUF2283 domain-containing protein [Candidatus Heimdallarchaeota archaeon]|nr:DUF2283 domain-containing protein [Candidatus Heimdallarchaeota archaeon]
MDFSYDSLVDALYIYINRGEIKETKQVNKFINIDFNLDDEIYGIEILNFSKSKINLDKLIKLSENELVATVSTL